jgi:hypothetical protein
MESTGNQHHPRLKIMVVHLDRPALYLGASQSILDKGAVSQELSKGRGIYTVYPVYVPPRYLTGLFGEWLQL